MTEKTTHENNTPVENTKNSMSDCLKNMCGSTGCNSKKFWLGAIVRIILMVLLILAAYKCGMHHGMMRSMYMWSDKGMSHMMNKKGGKYEGRMMKQPMMNRTEQQTQDPADPVMTIGTGGTGQ